MLVLSRKLGQQIVLSFNGTSATVQVIKVDGNRIRLGIDAPLDVHVKRSELIGDVIGHNDVNPNGLLAARPSLAHRMAGSHDLSS